VIDITCPRDTVCFTQPRHAASHAACLRFGGKRACRFRDAPGVSPRDPPHAQFPPGV